MNKKQALYVILASIALSLVINIFFGRFLAAKVSTIPLLNRWKILSPQAPIVINTREEVRMSDTQDVLSAVVSARPKLSGLIAVNDGQVSLVGGAVNLTSDGMFLTSKAAIAGVKPENLYVKLDDGTTKPVTSVFPDPATNLVILKAQLNNVPVPNISSSAGLSSGERIIFLAQTLKDFSPSFQASYVTQEQSSDFGSVQDADKPSLAFQAQSTGALLSGQAIVDMHGNVVGVWDGSSIVAGDVIKDLSNSFLSNGNKVVRPDFGFQYKNISPVQAKLLSQPTGASVEKVVPVSPAQKAGLAEGDIITSVGDMQLNNNNPLSTLLARYKPGDKVKFTVMRGKNKLDINLIVGELK